VPDGPGLELIRAEIEQRHPGAVLDTSFEREQAVLVADPKQILAVLRWLGETPGQEYTFLSSLHAADYLPSHPRFGIHYELLNRGRVERLRVKAMLEDPTPAGDAVAGVPHSGGREAPEHMGEAAAAGPAGQSLPEIDSCVEMFPTAEFQEREIYDFFGIVFRGHPDLRRILLPEDYVGWPQRRDFPVGGEPVRFTYNELAQGQWEPA
jgi:NADH-quinone oxidoreductase subunit C